MKLFDGGASITIILLLMTILIHNATKDMKKDGCKVEQPVPIEVTK